MPIVRVKHNRENPYTLIKNASLWDNRLSLEAIAVWARLISRPDNWNTNLVELGKACNVGKEKIRRILHELLDLKYAYRVQHRNQQQGTFADWEYWIFEQPLTDEEFEEFKKCLPETTLPAPAFPTVGKAGTNKEQKKINTKDCSVQPGSAASKRPGDFEKRTSSKESLKVSESEVFRYALQKHPDWTTEEIEQALDALWKCKGPVNSLEGFLEGTVRKIRNKRSFEKMEKAKCSMASSNPTPKTGLPNKEEKSQTKSSVKYADQDTIKRLLLD